MPSFVRSLGLLAVASLAAAQATELELEYEKAQFEQSKLVPDMLSQFMPSAVLSVMFGQNDANYGQALTIDQVKEQPTVMVNPAQNATDMFNSESTWTVAMVDPGVVGADQSAGQTRHWLVNGVKLSGDSAPYSLTYDAGTAVTAYGGPYPAEGSGPHRYTILLLPQYENFTAPSDLSSTGVTISTMDFPGYIQSTNLGMPAAGFYFTVEQGTTTSSIMSTTAVQSSTLAVGGAGAAASSSVMSASSSMMSGSASASATSSGLTKSAAAAASSAASGASKAAASATGAVGNQSGASQTASFGLTAVLGALGLGAALF